LLTPPNRVCAPARRSISTSRVEADEDKGPFGEILDDQAKPSSLEKAIGAPLPSAATRLKPPPQSRWPRSETIAVDTHRWRQIVIAAVEDLAIAEP